MAEVQVKVVRSERYAPHIEDYLEDMLPTEVVVKSGSKRRISIPAGTYLKLASYLVGAGSVLRVTRLSVGAGSASIFQLTDPNGTLQTYIESAGGIELVGEPGAPVHVAKSCNPGSYFTVGFFGTYGACTGTIRYFAGFEGIAVQRRVFASAPTAP